MTVLEVRAPGLQTTIQDGTGRPHLAAEGVPRGGAADPWGLAVANLVLGNDPAAAGIEIALLGPELVVLEPGLVGLGGADLGATVVETGRRIRPGSVHRLEVGTSIVFGERDETTGVRAYLALPGGVDVPAVLGSASTCLAGGFGGVDGRPLREGDRVAAVRRTGDGRPEPWAGPLRLADFDRPIRLRVTRGPHAMADVLDALVGAAWEVRPESNRMGLRLSGPTIRGGGRGDLVSFPTWWGAVQLPPDGEPLVLLVDGPTVGGYPVVAVVASADRPILGQLGAGDGVRFELVSEADAQVEATRRRLGQR